jgi:hypothetical protein
VKRGGKIEEMDGRGSKRRLKEWGKSKESGKK